MHICIRSCRADNADERIKLVIQNHVGARFIAPVIPIRHRNGRDKKSWGVSGWISDAVPHLIYGLVTAIAHETLRNAS